MARKPPEPASRETSSRAGARRGRPPGKAPGPGFKARRGRPPGKPPGAEADTPPSRAKRQAKAPSKRASVRRIAKPAPAPVTRRASGQRRGRSSAEALAGQMQQILDELGALRGITSAVQGLGAQLDAVLRQVGARIERDPGDAVPPGVAVQSPAPLNAADQAVLEKLETEPQETEDTKPRTSADGRHRGRLGAGGTLPCSPRHRAFSTSFSPRTRPCGVS
jgi:hypothetical protein